jgi:hypothetical protein
MGQRGAPTVRLGTQVLKAELGLQLSTTDTLVVPTGAVVVVELLGNGYVVAVDEDLELAVKDIALLKAPRATKSAAQQLDALVEARQIREGDRVIGYKAEKLAAQPRAKRALKAAPLGSEGSASVDAPAPLEPAGQPSASQTHGSPGQAAPSPGAPPPPPAKDFGAGASAKPVWTVVATRHPAPMPGVLASLLPQIGQCLAESFPALKATYRADRLRLRIVGGKIDRIYLASALPVPSCLDVLELEGLGVSDGLYEVAIGAPAK